MQSSGRKGHFGFVARVFYSAPDCKAPKAKWWHVSTQNTAKSNFPANFQLDGINDAASSFNVINVGGSTDVEYICGVTESLITANATHRGAVDGGSVAMTQGNL
ncbi:hypothetical protein PHYPSEUDO_004782 [Phytophthora pseudosyringae]|uniref:Uncharacterized protein n=1 Tax=Phytophthora pseudosyringae TaxID=221518 RepID=A0A8T1VMG1_9STRA|nr:hypothetical protein PHYPSEUDO_004782 [Phytophthora pseudosyringae]